VLPYCNTDGSEKLWPLGVGKFEKPHCMKGMKHYLCDYKGSKNAWLTGKIFRVAALLGEEDGQQKQKHSVAPSSVFCTQP
jgi:hypothetical protein